MSKLNLNRIKHSTFILNRFYSEMASYFKCSFFNFSSSFSDFRNKKIFLYFFQLECIRSAQFDKLFFSYDNYKFFSLNINFWKFKFIDISYYQTV